MKPRNWLDLAKNDIHFCEVMEQQLPQEYAKVGLCFHTQQAVEKLLKGYISLYANESESNDIAVLNERCDNCISLTTKEAISNIADVLTSWGNRYIVPEFDNNIYIRAKEIVGVLEEGLEAELFEIETMIDKLEYAIGQEYAEKHREWLNISHEELIEKADEVSAARFVKEHISDSFTEEEAEYLLQFKSPLEILVNKITALNDPNNIAVREQFSDMVSEMYDKQDEYADYELAENDGMQMQ
jgi:HEPN domain-containing protein